MIRQEEIKRLVFPFVSTTRFPSHLCDVEIQKIMSSTSSKSMKRRQLSDSIQYYLDMMIQGIQQYERTKYRGKTDHEAVVQVFLQLVASEKDIVGFEIPRPLPSSLSYKGTIKRFRDIPPQNKSSIKTILQTPSVKYIRRSQKVIHEGGGAGGKSERSSSKMTFDLSTETLRTHAFQAWQAWLNDTLRRAQWILKRSGYDQMILYPKLEWELIMSFVCQWIKLFYTVMTSIHKQKTFSLEGQPLLVRMDNMYDNIHNILKSVVITPQNRP